MSAPFDTVASSPEARNATVDFVPEQEQRPTQIGRYRIERVLGKGGFGIVFLGYDDQLQRPVAIKLPHRERVERLEDDEPGIGQQSASNL